MKGKCIVKVIRKNKVYPLTFVEVTQNVQTILGLSACIRINLVKRVLVVDSRKQTYYDELMSEYEDSMA